MTTEQNKSPPAHIPLDAQHYELIETCNALRTINAELLDACEIALEDYQQHIPGATTVPDILRTAITKAREQQ